MATTIDAVHEVLFLKDIYDFNAITQIFVKTVSNLVVALTIFELALVIDSELSTPHPTDATRFTNESLRRGVPRFIATVACALALEGLILIIKYNSEGAYDRIYIAIAVILSSAALVGALALFLKLHKPEQA
ncbi:hypothetical protein [Microbulbifer sp. SAOS-129_SWC]|uniref:hypothetical protein n=1 Tax=Microbulbifer sp. SAOS-129_SWC TaxID=3145235 RepID=UPI00321712C6